MNGAYNQGIPNTNTSYMAGQNGFGKPEAPIFSTQPTVLQNAVSIQQEIRQLEQEKYSLQQTLVIVQQGYDSGQITYVEFLRNFREMQKDLYLVQDRINQYSQNLRN